MRHRLPRISGPQSILLYLGAALAFTLITNARAQNLLLAVGALLVASAILGWATNSWFAFLLAGTLIPMSLPFGYANEYSGSDAPTVLLLALIWAQVSALVILAATWWRRVQEKERADESAAQTAAAEQQRSPGESSFPT